MIVSVPIVELRLATLGRDPIARAISGVSD